MNLPLMVVVTLVVCLGILGLAIIFLRHQRRLQEKKAEYMQARKERSFHYRRYTAAQVDLDHLRTAYNSRARDITVLQREIEQKKQEIKQILEILRNESRSIDEEMDRDLNRIIERRKGMIRALWQEMNGKKTLILEKLKQARQDSETQQKLIDKKEREFRTLSQLNSKLSRLKGEYEKLSRSSALSFGKD